MTTIVDYGLGNLFSVQNMIRKAGGKALITSDPEKIRKAQRLILPGIGAFATGMENMRKQNLHHAVMEHANSGSPLLGICLGAQLLTAHSEEGDAAGLGLIPGKTKLFKLPSDHLKVPHMGWNAVVPFTEHPLFASFPSMPRYYFVHSYYLEPSSQENTLCTTQYGITFSSGIHSGNIAGVQFHPEKSHLYGLRFIKNFLEWNP